MYYQPTTVSWGNYNFLILSAPDDKSMKRCIKVSHTNTIYIDCNIYYAQDLQNFNVKHLVRCCEKTYDTKQLQDAQIQLHELMFEDGKLPDQETIQTWFNLVDEFFDDQNKVPINGDAD